MKMVIFGSQVIYMEPHDHTIWDPEKLMGGSYVISQEHKCIQYELMKQLILSACHPTQITRIYAYLKLTTNPPQLSFKREITGSHQL